MNTYFFQIKNRMARMLCQNRASGQQKSLFALIGCIMIFGSILLLSAVENNTYPQDYFSLPVKRDILLSGTFGELRSNHFHAGIDIKSSKGQSGDPIHASAAGYISRIKTQAGSYGNVVYVDHPNGFTTVYAHLSSFDDRIATYVREKQYVLKKFDVDLYPKKEEFVLEDGAFIGKMGNSGNSFGPHLHFEIRETASQIPLNPLLFGLPLNDKIRPEIYQLAVYHLNDVGDVVHTEIHNVTKKATGSYTLNNPLKVGAWRVAFGIKSYDQMNGSYNKNGIYTLNMSVDSAARYNFMMDAIPFDMSRYINAHIDYESKKSNRGNIHRCFKVTGNDLKIYNTDATEGVVKLYKDKSQQVDIEILDAHENRSLLTFDISRADKIRPLDADIYHYEVEVEQPFQVEQENIFVHFPAHTFYQKAFLKLEADESDQYGKIFRIGEPTTPAHKFFMVGIKPDMQKYSEKQFIAYTDKNGQVSSLGGALRNGFLESKSRNLGNFSIAIDTIAPMVRAISFKKNMQGRSKMSFQITDNMPVQSPARGLKYEAYIDEEWVLMEYDGKNDLLTHHFLPSLNRGEHQLKLIVEDDRKNKTVYERVFTL